MTEMPKDTKVLLRYKGAADRKEFTNADFKSVEVEGQNKVVWTSDQPIQEVNAAAAEWLLSDASGEASNFTEATEEEVAEAGLNAQSEGDAPSDDSDGDGAADAPNGDADAGGLPGADDGTSRAKRGETGRGSSTAGDVTP